MIFELFLISQAFDSCKKIFNFFRTLFKKKNFQSKYLVHQKYLFREFNKNRNKGDYLIINLNPDIFHTIQFLRSNAEIISMGRNPENFNPIEREQLSKIHSGESEISFMDLAEGNITLFPEI